MTNPKDTPVVTPGSNTGTPKNDNDSNNPATKVPGQREQENDQEQINEEKVYHEHHRGAHINPDPDKIREGQVPKREDAPEVDPQRIDPDKTEENPGKQREREREAGE